MTHDEIKIVYEVMNTTHQEDLNEYLDTGFTILGEPLVVGKAIAFVLIRKGKPDPLAYNTPFPTDKQLGYVGWAYDLTEGYAASCRITRQEISKLIEVHKGQPEGVLLDKKAFDDTLASLRKKEDPEKFDDDMPF